MVSIWRLFSLVFIKDVHIVIVDIATFGNGLLLYCYTLTAWFFRYTCSTASLNHVLIGQSRNSYSVHLGM